jgi:oxaloacetate decarboxylase alpha subunit
MSEIQLVDTTLRDGQQCLWATRMPTREMLAVAEKLGAAGFQAVEVLGPVQVDSCVRYLHEDPWFRLRELRRRMPRVPLQAVIRSACVFGFVLQPQDLNELWVDQVVANGCNRIAAYDGFHDFDNIVDTLTHAKALGCYTVAWLVYSVSPVHTDELYLAKAAEIVRRAPVDEIQIQDIGGLLTPERAATLVPAIKSVVGVRRLSLHTHNLCGLSQRTVLEAVRLGVDTIYTSIAPLADGNAPPSAQRTIHNLRASGHTVDIDDALLGQVSLELEKIASDAQRPLGRVLDYDVRQFEHQVPGGAMSNLCAQLDELGAGHRLPEVLDECARVRRELGYPIMVTPFAQMVVVQATLNTLQGERYLVVPDNVKKYALGAFGKPLAPIDPNVLDRIIDRGSRSIGLALKPLEPVVQRVRREFSDASDEVKLLLHAFPRAWVEALRPEGGP